MNNLIDSATNFRERKVSVKRTISILAKNKVEVNEDEAVVILDFLYHMAATFHKNDSAKIRSYLKEHRNVEN
jgi:hypothetical protein